MYDSSFESKPRAYSQLNDDIFCVGGQGEKYQYNQWKYKVQLRLICVEISTRKLLFTNSMKYLVIFVAMISETQK